MSRRVIVGLIWCVILYFALRYVVAVIAGNLVTVEPGQDAALIRNQAALAADESWRYVIAFAVVGFVFFTSRVGILPGTRRVGSPLVRR